MGTNFYRQPIITEEHKQKIIHLITEGKLTSDWDKEDVYNDSALNYINWLCNRPVHICKRSSGWYICFDHNNGKYYQPNRKSIDNWLREPGYKIIDEYNTEYSVNEFWKMVDEWNTSRDDLWDDKKYTETHPNNYNLDLTEHKQRVKDLFNIDTKYSDFTVDGLRFAVFTDFC